MERVNSTVKEGRFQGGEGGQAKRASLGEVQGNMIVEWTQKLSRTICRVLVSLQVCLNLKWEARLGDEEPAHKMNE